MRPIVQADLADPDAAETIMAARGRASAAPPARQQCVAASSHDDIGDFTAEGWAAHLDVNLRAPALLSPRLRRARRDRAA